MKKIILVTILLTVLPTSSAESQFKYCLFDETWEEIRCDLTESECREQETTETYEFNCMARELTDEAPMDTFET